MGTAVCPPGSNKSQSAGPSELLLPQGRDWNGLAVICGENEGSRDEDREGIGVWLRQRLRKGKKGIYWFVLVFFLSSST